MVRAEGEREGRSLLVEAEITTSGRGRVQVNKQRLSRARDLLGALRVTVFSPTTWSWSRAARPSAAATSTTPLVARQPKLDAVRGDLERVLRQRNALLRQAGGRLTPDVEADPRGVGRQAGRGGRGAGRRPGGAGRWAGARCWPRPTTRWPDVRRTSSSRYEAPWREHGLAAALEAVRADELRRGVSLVGPHRDELALTLDGMPARTHASQGEQRSLALALRLAAHRVVTDATGSPPVLLLDDVFSELDPDRSAALLAHLPAGQTLLSSAAGLPPGADPELVLRVEGGSVSVSPEHRLRSVSQEVRTLGPCRGSRFRDAETQSRHPSPTASTAWSATWVARRPTSPPRSCVVGPSSSAPTSGPTAVRCGFAAARSPWPSPTLRGRRSCGSWRPRCIGRLQAELGADAVSAIEVRVRPETLRKPSGNARDQR